MSIVDFTKRKLMRRNLMTINPTTFKSGQDGKIYRKTGRIVKPGYVKPTGKVHVAPPLTAGTSEWAVLEPFRALMDKALKKKGIAPPVDMSDKAELFYNHIIGAKGFDGTKPMNFEAHDDADPVKVKTIIPAAITYFKSLIAGKQPNGQPLATQDQKLAVDARNVMQDLANKVGNAGLSPEDSAKAGAVMSNVPPKPDPFYKKPSFKWIAGGVALVIVLIIVFK